MKFGFHQTPIDWGHKNVIRYCNRPFETTEEMDEKMIENWNSVVHKRDVVYYVGDFSFYRTPEEVEKVVSRLNGQIHLILGNHDKKSVQKAKGFAWMGDYKEVKYSFHDDEGEFHKYKLILSHYPMQTWNRCHAGSIMIHGHSHGSLNTMEEYVYNITGQELKFPKPLRFDVGVDCWDFKPVNVKTIIRLAEEYKKYNQENFGHDLIAIDRHDGKRD